MFTDHAEFGKMLQSPETLKVSAIIHKAFIEVNEEGTEAAAATGKCSKSISTSWHPSSSACPICSSVSVLSSFHSAGFVMRTKRAITSLEEPIEFLVDHPFTYVLVHQDDLPLFWGSVVRLEENDSVSSEHDEL